MAFTPDGQALACGCCDGIGLWDLSTPLTAVTLTPGLASPQPFNTPITLTAAATGGTNVQYQFWVYNPTATPAWSELQAFSASATCTWTPSAPGNYLLSTTAQDGVTGAQESMMLWYGVTGSPLTGVTLQTSPASPQPSNTPITLTAAATGGANVAYQFWLYNPTATPAWSQLQAYSALATCCWTPSTPGNYFLSATAQDGVTGTEQSSTLWYTVDTTLTAVSLTMSPTSPQMTNTPVTLTAAATGGSNVEYQFWLYTPGATPAWSELQGFSASATCTWTPSAPGNYLLSTSARDGVTGAEVSQMYWYTVTGPLLTAVSLATSPASPQPSNTAITLSDSATGGANVQYQFWLYNPTATPAWRQLQAYSASATCSWTPTMPGNYLLSTSARDGVIGTEVSQMSWYTVTGPLLTAVSLTTSPGSPQPSNTPITLTAIAAGGANVQYQFWLYNPAIPAWSQLQAYSSSATCPWTPGAPGNYLLSVTARDGVTGKEVSTMSWYGVTSGSPLTAVSMTASPSSPQAAHTPITLSAVATGGTNVQYQFWQYNPGATPAWSELQAYSTAATCPWTPQTPGSYLLSVTAQDEVTGAEVSTMFWYTVQ